MQYQFFFKKMSTSPALQQYTEEKISEKIKKFVTKPIEVQVTFSQEHNEFIVKCILIAGDGFDVQVEQIGADMYGTVDQLTEKLTTQIQRHKDKLKFHKKKIDKSKRFQDAKEQINIEREEIDAEDIVKYEKSRKKLVGECH